MSSKQIKISDTFEQSTCGVCGCCEINQYFTINDNFIEYSGTFISLREVLKEALDLKVDTKSLEICLDCKDKVIKFYHFKRKVHDAQKTKHFRPGRSPRQKEKRSKVVHSIVKIVEDYTEKCSVSTIKVDENSRKLIIEPKVHPAAAPTTTITSHTKHASATRSLANENDELLDEMFVETPTFDTSENMMADPVNIKQEEVFGEPINYIDPSDTSNMQDDNDDMGDDDSNYNDPDYSYNYGASTSSQAFPPVSKKRKTDANKSSNEETSQVTFEEENSMTEKKSNNFKRTSVKESLDFRDVISELSKVIHDGNERILKKIQSVHRRIDGVEGKGSFFLQDEIIFKKIKSDEELMAFNQKMGVPEEKLKIIKYFRKIPDFTHSYKESHGKVAMIIEELFEKELIARMSWSSMPKSSATVKTKIQLVNYPWIFEIATKLLEKRDGDDTLKVDAESVRRSFQHYFRFRAKNYLKELSLK